MKRSKRVSSSWIYMIFIQQVLFKSFENVMCLTFIYVRFCNYKCGYILIEEHNVNLSTHRHYQYAYQAFRWLFGDVHLNDFYDSILLQFILEYCFIVLSNLYKNLICKFACIFFVVLLSWISKVTIFIFSYFCVILWCRLHTNIKFSSGVMIIFGYKNWIWPKVLKSK